MSSVFSIELDGISNACTTNVMMNNPVTNTAASDERNSTVDSLGFSSAKSSTRTVSLSFFANFAVFFSVITLGFRAELNFGADTVRDSDPSPAPTSK